MKYIKYLAYLLNHKWYVLIECFKIGLYWQGLIHDNSKFLPSEFIPYANYFYGRGNYMSERYNNNYSKVNETGDINFDFAWFLHQKRNKHHWQYWIIPLENGSIKTIEIPLKYQLEMLCDWIGAARAQGKISPKEDRLFNVRKWWNIHKNSMQLHSKTRIYFEIKLK